MTTRELYRNRGLFGMRNALAAGIATALVLTLSASGRAATITVDSLADRGAAGICTLRDAILAANTMSRTYNCAAGTGNDTIHFRVTGTIVLGSRLPQLADPLLTIIGPSAPGITISGGGQMPVMAVASGATLRLRNLTIANGSDKRSGVGGNEAGGIENDGTLIVSNTTFAGNSATGPGDFNGGAILNYFGALTVAYSTFSGNSGSTGVFAAGAILNYGGTLTVANSTFSGNSGGFGGAILNDAGTLTVTNSSFSDNSNTGYEGGGIANWGVATATVINSTFSGNSANQGGGAILNPWGATLTITHDTFASNSLFWGGFGGAIENGGDMTVTNSTFSSNSNSGGSGGGIDTYGNATVTNTTFSGNSGGTDGLGGGISNGDGGRLTVTNCTFSGNSAGFGGGIENEWGLSVTNTTFSGNNGGLGGAIGNAFFGGVSLNSTIVAASGGGNCDVEGGGIFDAGYNISDDSSCGFGSPGSLDNTDPQLDPAGLSSHGGPTQTIALVAGSPAIDAIPLADCTDQESPPNPITTDQRGFPRPDNGESACDIGAYEAR
jgi:CSLREA domain-containing protein